MKITKPTFIINKRKCIENIEFIQEKTKKNELSFRPHFKTHQSEMVSEWFRDLGITKIAVSSVDMAIYFIERQWKDITIAFPFNVLQTQEVNSIDESIQLNLLVDSIETIHFLANHLKRKTGIFIEIEISYARSGIKYSKTNLISEITDFITSQKIMEFKGFLIHAGNTYSAKNKQEVLQIHTDNLKVIQTLKQKFKAKFPNLIISYGDTPTASIADNFSGIDELRPGNFVYYDLMQESIESCAIEKIAAFVLAPVVGIKKETLELVLYSGAVHLSKDFLWINDEKNFGQVYSFSLKNNEIHLFGKNYIYSLSQEHALVKCSEEFLGKLKVGDLVAILPVHSCLTANLLKTSSLIIE